MGKHELLQIKLGQLQEQLSEDSLATRYAPPINEDRNDEWSSDQLCVFRRSIYSEAKCCKLCRPEAAIQQLTEVLPDSEIVIAMVSHESTGQTRQTRRGRPREIDASDQSAVQPKRKTGKRQ